MEEKSEIRDKTMKDDEENIPNCPRFDPPMSIRRYSDVSEFVKSLDEKSLRVVDFGCSDLNFLRYLKRIENVVEVAAVDIDECILQCNRFKATPLAADFLCRRTEPLSMSIFSGNMVENDTRVQGFEVVTCIELIEHLHDDILRQVPEAIFGFVRPKLAVLTTPNSDFNVLFPTLKGFRHWDHKFEWTRKEFQEWCDEVVRKYPAYSYTCEGIGKGPAGTESLGCCSQAAIFRLQDYEYRNVKQDCTSTTTPYKLLTRVDHPYRKVEEPNQDSLMIDIEYFLGVLAKRMDWSKDPVLIPIHKLLVFPKIKEFFGTVEALRDQLVTRYKVVFLGRKPCVEYQLADSDDENVGDLSD